MDRCTPVAARRQRQGGGPRVGSAGHPRGSHHHELAWQAPDQPRSRGQQHRRDPHPHRLHVRQQEQVRAVVHRVGETLAQFGDEGGGGPHQATPARDVTPRPGVGGQAAELQSRLACERRERVRGGEGDVVAGLAQYGAQPRVRGDVASRPCRRDHDSHRLPSRSVRSPEWRAALACTALRR